MKKYNTPIIEALALETIDVIAASAVEVAAAQLSEQLAEAGITPDKFVEMGEDIAKMGNKWSW